MKNRDIQSISETLSNIMETSNEIKLQCMSYLDSIKTIHGNLQELLNIHEKFPESFLKNNNVACSILELIELSKKLLSDTENSYFAKILDTETNIKSIKKQIITFQISPEFSFFEKNISIKINHIENNLNSINHTQHQLKSYIDYQNRILESIVKR